MDLSSSNPDLEADLGSSQGQDSFGDQDPASLDSQPIPAAFTPVTEEQAALGRQATKFYNDGNFDECMAILEKLAEMRPDDTRVKSNQAVCSFLVDDNKVQGTSDLNNAVHAIHGILKETTNGGADLDVDQEIEHCVLLYNMALLRFSTFHFVDCERILSKLYTNILNTPSSSSSPRGTPMLAVNPSKMDIAFAKDKIVPLLICVNLMLRRNNTALALIAEAEAKAKEEKDDSLLQIYSLYRSQALIQAKQHKAFKRDIKGGGPNGGNGGNGGDSLLTFEILKSHNEYARGNFGKAKKLITMALEKCNNNPANAIERPHNVKYITSILKNNDACTRVLCKEVHRGQTDIYEAMRLHQEVLRLHQFHLNRNSMTFFISGLAVHSLVGEALVFAEVEAARNDAQPVLHAFV